MGSSKNGQCRSPAPAKCEKMTCIKPNRRAVQFSDLLCVVFAAGTLAVDLITDILVAIEYWKTGDSHWCFITVVFIVIPVIIIQIFSLRWFSMDDDNVTIWHWLSHGTCLGLLYRFILIIKTAMEAKRSKSPQDCQRVFSQQSDLYMLHLFESCLEAAPQFVLQMYVTIYTNKMNTITMISAACSIASIVCAALAYGQGHIGSELAKSPADLDSMKWRVTSMVLKASWRLCTFSARITAFIMFALLFNAWIFIPLACHWLTMSVWIIYQNTNFCSSKIEEILYNIVVGFMYCFCYFNLKDGQTRYRIITFYSITVLENVAIFIAFMMLSNFDQRRKMIFSIIGFVTIIGGTVVGICSMIIYYRWFHPVGAIKWRCESNGVMHNIELGTGSTGETEAIAQDKTIRSLKQTHEKEENGGVVKQSNNSAEVQLKPECTDKKTLLDHWIARTGTPTFASVPILNMDETNNMSGIEFHSVKTTPEKSELCVAFHKSQDSKRKGISSIEDIDQNEKRCGEESSEDSKPKASSDFDCDLDLSFSDINSSDINEFNENIVQKLCLSTLKNIKDGNQDADIKNIQRIAVDILKEMYGKKGDEKIKSFDLGESDTPSEMLSVHDYENICAVNIAREAWGLRSWGCYSDIENWLHDDSTVRDRRLDTFTSASSEICSSVSARCASPPPIPARKPAIYSNVLVGPSRERRVDYIDTLVYEMAKCEDSVCDGARTESNVFIAKPYVVDQNGGLLPLTVPLEPILEELDEIPDQLAPATKKKRLNSESSLVATIDEIRKDTLANSPRNVYHRTENLWDSPQPCAKPNVRRKKRTINEHDLSHKEVLFLSNLVADSKLSSNIEDSNNYISSSLQSLIAKDNNSEDAPTLTIETTLKSNKNNSNRPRRKFSLLRERFESKCIASDKEILFETKTNSQNDLKIPPVENTNDSSIIPTLSDDITDSSSSCTSVLKQKRSLFLKQVLSPQKFNGWSKK